MVFNSTTVTPSQLRMAAADAAAPSTRKDHQHNITHAKKLPIPSSAAGAKRLLPTVDLLPH
eukprot:5596544-Pleurochrysis_carterae.AAC.1